MEQHILVFTILDDFQTRTYQEIILKDLTHEGIKEGVIKVVERFRKERDPAGYFDEDFFSNKCHLENIVAKLVHDKYFVCNRYEKYYVIAFSIDFTRFEIFSKDCDKRLIDW